MKNIEEANTNPFPKNLPLKQSNTTTHFQKLFFSNNQTQQPKRNNEINKPKTHLGFCSSQIIQVLLELLGLDRNCEDIEAHLGFAGIGWGFAGVAGIGSELWGHQSSPGFYSNRIKLGFCYSWVLLEFVEGKNSTKISTKSSPIGSSSMLKSSSLYSI